MTDNIRMRVNRFSDALAFAIYDRELELHEEKLIYYLDSNVVFRMILGLEAEAQTIHPKNNQHLVRALFSCGYLGPFCVLRPHALELNELLRTKGISFNEANRTEFMDKVREFLNTRGIREIMSRLYNISVGKNGYINLDSETRVCLFIDGLRDNAGEIFSYLEQINGTWRQRLKRYFDEKLLNLNGKDMGPETHTLMTAMNKELHTFNRLLQQSRRHPFISVSAFQDALALAILHQFILNREAKTHSAPIVRFYTESHNLHKDILQKSELRKLLSYREPLIKNLNAPKGAELVIRDAGYFIMRAWFSELIPTGTLEGPASLGALKELSQKLGGIINQIGESSLSEEIMLKAIEKIEHKESRLVDLIDRFEKLTIMNSIWVGGRIPKAFKSLEALVKWTEVFEFAEKPDTTDALFKEIMDTRLELERKVHSMMSWKKILMPILTGTKIQKQTETLRCFLGEIIDPVNSLGLVRFGYALNVQEKQILMEMLNRLFREDDIDLIFDAGKVATFIENAQYDLSKCMVSCAVLWALRLYEEIVKLVEDYRENEAGKRIHPGLLVFQAAAEFKTGQLSPNQRNETVTQLLELLDVLTGEQRVGVLLGIGYILIQAWEWETVDHDIAFQSSNGSGEPGDKKKRIDELAQKCFDLGEEAVEKIPKDELAWAFAVNYCSYVGTVTGIESEKTEYYFQNLLSLEHTTRWNFRFDDTVGTYYYYKAKRKWAQTKKEERKNLKLVHFLDRAEVYFKRSGDFNIGDIDVETHLNQLTTFKLQYKQTLELDDQ